jgi:hypothetical protein
MYFFIYNKREANQMKSIFYLLTILFLSLLLACSEEPPTNVELESLSKKPRPPEPTEPLVLLDNANQIVGISSERIGNKTKDKIKVWTYGSGTYLKSWEKGGDGTYEVSAIGDVDNDGNDELVVVYVYETGKGRNKVIHTELQVFENGDTDNPSRISNDLSGDGVSGFLYMRLGDANNDGTLEIMFAHSNCVSVYKDNGSEVTMLWKSEDLSAEDPWSIDAGDPDNDGQNEIIYAELGGSRFGVYEYLGNNEWGSKVYSELLSFCGLDRAFVADVDGDGDNEVIGGGCHQKITIWEYLNGSYTIDFESAELNGFTQGVAAGDFDNDGLNEIAVGTANPGDNKIVVFKYNETTLTYTNIFEEPVSGIVNDMFAGDSDNDGIDEFIVATGENLLVYDFITEYNQTYSDPGSIFPVVVK